MSLPDWMRVYARSGAEVPAGEAEQLSDEQREELREMYRVDRWRHVAPGLGVPTRLLDASLASDPTPAIKRVADFLDADLTHGRCLVLTGPTGVGKSWAAAAGMRECGIRGRRFWYFPSLCGAWLDKDRRQEALELSKRVAFAVFDDFGVEYVKEGGLIDAFLDELIYTREAEMLPTIITTNLTTDGLKARLSARLVDRLRGDWGRIFECPGESLRA